LSTTTTRWRPRSWSWAKTSFSYRCTRRCARDEPDVSINRVFFGGINVYLQEKLPLFRHTPWWMDHWLDNPALLNSLSGRAGSVDPTRLGDLTVSMLRGEAGNQRKEVEKLVRWLLTASSRTSSTCRIRCNSAWCE